jgi:hypothetical protein
MWDATTAPAAHGEKEVPTLGSACSGERAEMKTTDQSSLCRAGCPQLIGLLVYLELMVQTCLGAAMPPFSQDVVKIISCIYLFKVFLFMDIWQIITRL